MYMLKRAPTIAALGFGLLAGACGGHDGGATGPGAGVNGSYSLRRVNHVEVPAEAELEWGTAGFRSGSLQLTGEGSWQMQIRYDNLDSGESTDAAGQRRLRDGRTDAAPLVRSVGRRV
jgi:hypothetical protein